MGYPRDLFINQQDIDPEFNCSICQCVLKDPKLSESCHHIFCNSCLEFWIERSPNCPVDGVPIHGLIDPIRPYMRMYNRLQLRCKFDGCSEVCSIENIEVHHMSCDYDPSTAQPCADNCGAVLTRAAALTHGCVEFLKAQLTVKDERHTEEISIKDRETDSLLRLFRKRGALLLCMGRLNRKNEAQIVELRRLNLANEQEITDLKEIVREKDLEIQLLHDQLEMKEAAIKELSCNQRKRAKLARRHEMTTSDGDSTGSEERNNSSESEEVDESDE